LFYCHHGDYREDVGSYAPYHPYCTISQTLTSAWRRKDVGMLGKNRGRPFWISDAIVLVAATACGLALRPSVHWMDSELIPIVFTAARIRNGLQAWADELAPILGAWTLALALLSLRSPRSLRLSRHAGLAVVWGASIGLLVHIFEVGVSAAKLGLDWGAFYFRIGRDLYAVQTAVRLLLSERCVQPPAVATLTALGLHALGRRRWVSAGWIDRAGLAVGVCWITLMLMLWCL
jgi:hypothetical protein